MSDELKHDPEQRRQFLRSVGMAGLAGLMLTQGGAANAADSPAATPAAKPAMIPPGTLGKAGAGPGRLKIAMLIHPKMVLQDLVGPLTVFNMMQAEIHLVWKNPTPVSTDTGVTIAPTTLFRDCPENLDVLFAPGGLDGTTDCIEDPEVIAFFKHHGKTAKWITSDCTGALLLGAAGLLQGYNAASHWTTMQILPAYGATPVHKRVVVDRNRVTGGGVTAGIDFGLTLAAILRGEDQAQQIQLIIEYAPEPPFNAGRPETAPAGMADRVRKIRSGPVNRATVTAAKYGAALKT